LGKINGPRLLRKEKFDFQKVPHKEIAMHLVIIGFGQVALYKYLELVFEALSNGKVSTYSIIDLNTQKDRIDAIVLGLAIAPTEICYLKDLSHEGVWSSEDDFGPILQRLKLQYGLIKAIITTEVKAHEGYLRYCVKNDISSLVEKPILLPMSNGRFSYKGIAERVSKIIAFAKAENVIHSVMSLGRYHQFFEDDVRLPLEAVMRKFGAPITSLHLRTNSGVWNLQNEYLTREDHPYKYGYGMLMHGAYHYVDILATFLSMNCFIYPNRHFEISLSSFVAHPCDQSIRIPKRAYDSFLGDVDESKITDEKLVGLGETDIVTSYCLRCVETGQVLTLGTLGLEQTTPSMRNWVSIPEGVYNRNGRVSLTEIEAQLSTIYSINGRLFKVPKPTFDSEAIPDSVSYAETISRTNAKLIPGSKYLDIQKREKFTKTSKNELIRAWIHGTENRSTLISHLPTMILLEAIAKSIDSPGKMVTTDF
jgi:hypothetical protein